MKTLLSTKMALENEIAACQKHLDCNKLEKLLQATNKKYNEINQSIGGSSL